MAINLDNLADSGDVQHRAGGEEVSGLPTFERREAAAIYDQFQKLMFVLDDSGSMGQRLMGVVDLMAEELTDEDRLHIAQRIENARVRAEAEVKAALEALENEDEPEFDIVGGDEDGFDVTGVDVCHTFQAENLYNDKQWNRMAEKNDESRKAEVLKSDSLCQELGISRHGSTPPTKNEAMKAVVGKEIRERYMKFGTPDIQVIKFEESFEIFRTIGEEEILKAVDSLSAHGWDTMIFPPLNAALALCKRAPSAVGCHHIILVTDGLSEDGDECLALLPECLRLNVVVDFIHIADEYDKCSDWSQFDQLKKLSEESGGKFYSVTTVRDFEKVFFESSKRLMLAPADPK